jgi:hypothetical protein
LNGAPIRSNVVKTTPYTTVQPSPARVVAASPYRVQPSPARVVAASPYRVQPSPARVMASPAPVRTYAAPTYGAPLNLNAS